MSETPISLLERLRKPGDEGAWFRFVQLYTPLLYQWALRLGHDQESAGDLVQDVFAILVDQMPAFEYQVGGRFRGWLWTITRNKARERGRRSKALSLGDTEAEGADTISEYTEAEYRQYLTSRAMQLLRSDFEPQTWKAFWEHVVNERSAPEVAREFGISVGAVYAAKTRILTRLREELRGLIE